VTWVRLGGKYCIAYNYSQCAIYVPKLIKVGKNLSKFSQKQKCRVFLRHDVCSNVYYTTLAYSNDGGGAWPLPPLHPLRVFLHISHVFKCKGLAYSGSCVSGPAFSAPPHACLLARKSRGFLSLLSKRVSRRAALSYLYTFRWLCFLGNVKQLLRL